MPIALTASEDVCQPTTICLETSRKGGSSSRRTTLRNLTRGFSFGACLTLAISATPAAHSAPAAETHLLPPVTVVADPDAVRRDSLAPTDPLKAVSPVEPAVITQADLQRQIVISLPLTDPGLASRDDEEPISRELTEYMDFEEMRVPVWIVDTILRASKLTGADPVYMMALADKESSFLPGNKASTSSAVGLFQFIASTWLEAVRSFGPMHGLIAEAESIDGAGARIDVENEAMREHILGLRRNPYISALMAAEMMKRDKTKIEAKLGRKLSRSEFYLSHFFGVDSASKFIALVDDTPKKSARDAFPAAAKSNKSLFFTKDGKKTRQLSVAEVYDRIDGMIDKRLNRYEAVSARVTADASTF